ncbi:hypothetical protein [Chitinophaga sancti]|uniref:Uncharacterized protein n=1 Tax=Chitinophaga sancti TaxID=1004 RepID=A0A1K1M696_9BACT|nr:hypothetical protein [Chitinophaga sancti]WQD64602.1 hypothetical protein U0033_09360 [Chitinophaga sancti]WQG89774.1 hypothetical protein SR876_33115 [Chitinophaga sancti]SFW18619.1 hypothetical protein SAMN05661012_00481 [Chitinophaga sancti]
MLRYILLLIVFASAQVYAQKTGTVSLDFKTKAINFPTGSFQKGDAIQLSITNYNANLYKLEIGDVDTAAVAPPNNGTLISGLQDDGNLAKLVANLSSAVVAAAPLAVAGNKSMFADFPPKKPKDELSVEDVQQLEIDTILNMQHELYSLKQDAEWILYKYREQFLVQTVPAVSCDLSFDAEIKEIAHNMDSLRSALLDLRYRLEVRTIRYVRNISKYAEKIEKDKGLKNNDTLIRKYYEDISTSVIAAQENVDLDHQATLICNLRVLQLTSSGCYVSLPMYLLDDVKKVTISITPRYDSLNLGSYKTTFMLPWVQHKVWGISAGIYTSTLYNDVYSGQQQSDSTFSIVQEKHSGKMEFGINALAYTGWNVTGDKSCNYLGMAFGIGMSVSEKPKPRVLLGMSFITGEKNRLMVSAGLIAGFVNRLSSAYKENTTYSGTPGTFVKDGIKPGAFLSVNYSFLN